MNPLLTKTVDAGGTIYPCRLVKFGSSDNNVIQATDGSASIIGVSDKVGIDTSGSTASGERLDVTLEGIALVKLGGTVTRGGYITADANGKGVAVTIVAGTTVYAAGQAMVSGVDGDVIPVFIRPTVIANDTAIVQADVTITTGQLLALNATPKTLVAAPGAGKAIIVEDLQLFLDYNSVAYNGVAAGEDLELRYTDGSGQLVSTIETTGFIDQTSDQFRHVRPVTTAAMTPVANAAVVLRLASGEVATGNSPLLARIRYRTVDVTW